MERICFNLTVRQRRCINGIATNVDNIYTNVANNSVFPLGFGYTLTFVSNGNSTMNTTATIRITNETQIPGLTFTIQNNDYKIFDLPTSAGNLRVLVGINANICTSNKVVCCRM